MKYLVDANVLSEPTKASPNPNVVRWLRQNEGEIAVDPIILGEIRFGILLPRLRTSGRAMPIKDSLIAATALQHGLVVATRNTKDFAKAGVKVLDHFTEERRY